MTAFVGLGGIGWSSIWALNSDGIVDLIATYPNQRGGYRRHSPQFKIQIRSDIRSGKIGRREALKTHNLSANLMQMWLGQFDRGELDAEDAAASTVAEYEAHIAALERKVGQLTMELDLLKKRHGYDSSATARTHRSSAAPSLLHPTRISNDRSAA